MGKQPPLTPAEISAADELMAYARDDLAALVRNIRAGNAVKGEAQNGANFTAWLCNRYPSAYLAVLVIAAARQIAAAEQEASP